VPVELQIGYAPPQTGQLSRNRYLNAELPSHARLMLLRMRIAFSWIMTGCCVGHLAWASERPLDEARSALEQWVQTRQLVAKTQSDWAAEREVLEASVRMFERELKELGTKMAALGESSSQVANEREQLEAEKALLGEASAVAQELAHGLEQRVQELVGQLPEPLVQRIRPLLDRFPEDSAATRLRAAERLQTLLGVLNEIDKFNGSISVESEIRPGPDGREVQVETLYLGLAQAYFVGEGGKFAGVMVPMAGGWKATERDDLGPVIGRAIAMYRNQEPAALLALPFEVR
jgi:hypothetical protein